MAEAEDLAANGAKEINLIAQDTTRYGDDLYGEYKLAELLRRLCKIEGIRWIRVLYGYPDRVTDELLEVMATEEKVVNYGCGLNYTANKWKISAGADYKINKKNKLTAFYRFQTDDDDDEPNGHIVGVGYKLSF